MKKLVVILLGLSMAFMLCACDELDEFLEEDTEYSSDSNTGSSFSSADYSGNPKITFSTTDINGNPVSDEVMRGSKVVLLNLWEPWCGPCVNEMPDLQALYEKYKDQGLLVIGVYSSFDMDSDAKQIVSENGITYPILRCNGDLSKYEQNYVPATYILTGDGNMIETEPISGSYDYNGWEYVITKYLN